MNKTLCLVSVGEEYNHTTQFRLRKIVDRGYDIHLLTDSPLFFSEFGNKITTYKYDKTIFNYLDKIEFAFKICENLRTNVFYIDVNKISKIPKKLDEQYELYKGNRICFKEYWIDVVDTYLSEMIYVKKYFENKNLDLPQNIRGILETHMFIPYNKDIFKIKNKFEELKIVFTFQTLMDIDPAYNQRYNTKNIGYGGGRLLYLLFDILNINYNLILQDKNTTLI